jgi:murein DD-endopeptidase MepM/ murein hydrolase activator NlpD
MKRLRSTPNLLLPLKNTGEILSDFRQRNFYDNQYWGIHLGVDVKARAGTEVYSAGRGVVAYSKLHLGEFSENGEVKKRNWGGIVIIAHKNLQRKQIFYSLYGHLGKRYVKEGDPVEAGELIGEVGKSMTESNGLWKDEHLHFAVYTGPYETQVLPGYYNEEEKNTSLEDWHDPVEFIRSYNPKNI